MQANFHLALLHFVHLLIGADGVADESEVEALRTIKAKEGISEHTFTDFNTAISSGSEREVYQQALNYLLKCNHTEKLKVFTTLYRLSEVDGRVHTKEIKLLLYSIKDAGIEFDDVVDYAKTKPSIF